MDFNDIDNVRLFDYVYDADSAMDIVREGILTKDELDLILDDDTELTDIRDLLIEAAISIDKLDGWAYNEYSDNEIYIPEDDLDD